MVSPTELRFFLLPFEIPNLSINIYFFPLTEYHAIVLNQWWASIVGDRHVDGTFGEEFEHTGVVDGDMFSCHYDIYGTRARIRTQSTPEYWQTCLWDLKLIQDIHKVIIETFNVWPTRNYNSFHNLFLWPGIGRINIRHEDTRRRNRVTDIA